MKVDTGLLTLKSDSVLLALVDIQEGFRPAVLDFDSVASNAARLVKAASILKIPVLVTEQYPKGLGDTVPEVEEHLSDAGHFEKSCFSATDLEQFNKALDDSGRKQVLLCGIESHVCVWQTAAGLISKGLTVHVASDAVSSRSESNRQIGLRKMESAGAVLTSVETALFEILGRAGTDQFKAVQKLVM